MKAIGWTVLALVFVDELLALAALAVWGNHAAGIPLAVGAPAAWAVAWFLFAAPSARFSGRFIRPTVKVIAFGLACLALWAAGHAALAAGLLIFSAAINGLAQLPRIRALQATTGGPRAARHTDAVWCSSRGGQADP
ncbi:MAG TPA: DUF2568 domain-containing protein [Trebonia sp.]